MTKITSTRPLKYDPIKPQLEGVIELRILEVKDLLQDGITAVTVADVLVTGESYQTLNTRIKTLTFAEVDQLEVMLAAQLTLEGSYMEKRLQLLQAGLLYITQTDENPIYFSTAEDWAVVTD